MSKIGIKPVNVNLSLIDLSLNNNILTLTHSVNKKQVNVKIPEFLSLFIEGNILKLSKNTEIDNKTIRSMFGTIRQEIFNSVYGLENGFTKTIKLFGVGYKLIESDNEIWFYVGFSHHIVYKKKLEFTYSLLNKSSLSIFGINKQSIGQEISLIKRMKKRNIYDCYGIYEENEKRIKKIKKK